MSGTAHFFSYLCQLMGEVRPFIAMWRLEKVDYYWNTATYEQEKPQLVQNCSRKNRRINKWKQVEISRKIEVSNRKNTLQNRKNELTSHNVDCALYFAPNAKISVFVHEVIEVHIVNNVGWHYQIQNSLDMLGTVSKGNASLSRNGLWQDCLTRIIYRKWKKLRIFATDKSEFVWNTFILLAKPFAV